MDINRFHRVTKVVVILYNFFDDTVAALRLLILKLDGVICQMLDNNIVSIHNLTNRGAPVELVIRNDHQG